MASDGAYLITGATSGIGLEAARGLARLGRHLVLIARNPAKAEGVRAVLSSEGPATIDILQADLASLGSVRAAAQTALDRYHRIGAIVSNAGVFRVRRHQTIDGLEETFAVNHLAPFLLINLLADRLRASEGARVVVVASAAHHGGSMNFDDLMFERRYRAWGAYCRSKLANVMFTCALARRLEGSAVTANACHPGFVRTGLGSGNGVPMKPVYALLRPFTISAADGARAALHLATSKDVEGMSGHYFDALDLARSSRASMDIEAQEMLWEHSARLVGLA